MHGEDVVQPGGVTHSAWEGKKMSNIKPDDFRKHAAEEDFFRLAAMEIESEQNEEFLEAQSLPDPSPEVLARMQKNLQTTMRKTRKRKRHRTIFLQLGRLTACMAVVCGVLFSGAYFGVDAARNSINNFVLEMFDDHSTINTEASTVEGGIALPKNWNGPFYVTWVPQRFVNVRAKGTDSIWTLTYEGLSKDDNLSVYVWDAYHAPNINTEQMQLLEDKNIQDSPAKIYTDTDGNNCMLIWAKENYVIQIGGAISPQEAKKIAEKFVF